MKGEKRHPCHCGEGNFIEEKRWELKGRNKKDGSPATRKEKIMMVFSRCESCGFTIRETVKEKKGGKNKQ